MIITPEHASEQELLSRLSSARAAIEVGAVYTHYKNPSQPYKVLAVALLEATEAPCVVYQALYGEEKMIWVRAVDAWMDEVSFQGRMVPRFQKVQQEEK